MKELTRRWKAEQKRVLALLSEAVRLQFICRLGYGDALPKAFYFKKYASAG